MRIKNPPDASSLMTTARSFGNYDLAGALADLIDNSITARASRVEVVCDYLDNKDCKIRIRDDGCGMDRDELVSAMRPASTSPENERSPDDLGRFGWGMKSASFSQCRVLTVISARDGIMSGAKWNLDDIDEWSMDVFDHEIASSLAEAFPGGHGTEIIWQNCDRLSEDRSLTRQQFNELISQAVKRLALTFHRFLAGEPGIHKLKITVNGTPVDLIDPFCKSNPATRPFNSETIPVNGKYGDSSQIVMQAFTLPHYSKLTGSEHDIAGGEEGYVRNQGFYVYRNHRLIIYGTWFKLAKHGELSKLVRIRVDIPNTLDEMWKITVDKSDAQLPSRLKARMKALIDEFRNSSVRVIRSKGARTGANGTHTVWGKLVRNNMIRYRIDRKHPLIKTIRKRLDRKSKASLDTLMNLIEAEIPLDAINADISSSPKTVQQRLDDRETVHAFISETVPLLRTEYEDVDTFKDMLRNTEPFASNWQLVEEVLEI